MRAYASLTERATANDSGDTVDSDVVYINKLSTQRKLYKGDINEVRQFFTPKHILGSI